MPAPINPDTPIPERSAGVYRAVLRDQDGEPIPVDALDALTLTLTDVRTGRTLRHRQDALGANGVTVDDAGNLVWQLLPTDTALATYATREGSTESRLAVFDFTWRSGSLSGTHSVRFLVRRTSPEARIAAIIRGDHLTATFYDLARLWPDLTDAEAVRFTVRREHGAQTIGPVTATVLAAGDDVQGVSIAVPGSAADLDPGAVLWDVEAVLADGTVTTLLLGPSVVVADVTRSTGGTDS